MRFIVLHLEKLHKMALRLALRTLTTGSMLLSAAAMLLSAAAMLSSPAFAASPGKEVGIWYDDSGDGAIKVEPCGDKLCGKIFWLKEPLNAKGIPLVDGHNPDSTQRTRTICGLPIFGGLVRQPEGGYDAGWVYDPKEGKSYSFAVASDGPDKLQVTGYIGMKLLGRTMVWTRAPATLPNCSATAAAAPAPAAASKAPVANAGGIAPAAPASAKSAGNAATPAPPVKAQGAGEKLPWNAAKAPAPTH